MTARPRKPPLVAGLEIATLVTSAAFQLAIPPAVGAYVDHRWGTGPWGLIVGALLGVAAFVTSLRHVMRRLERSNTERSRP